MKVLSAAKHQRGDGRLAQSGRQRKGLSRLPAYKQQAFFRPKPDVVGIAGQGCDRPGLEAVALVEVVPGLFGGVEGHQAPLLCAAQDLPVEASQRGDGCRQAGDDFVRVGSEPMPAEPQVGPEP